MITTILAGVFTLAIVAVVFSSKATTAAVLGGAGTALSSVIQAAVSPVTGSAVNLSTNVSNPLGTTTANPQVLGTYG
jgi:hypothetical protein